MYFTGIPYAKAPTGNLRFEKPRPYGSFKNSVQNATSFGSACSQFLFNNKPTGNEDCLFLNVYTPSKKVSNKPKVGNVF